MFRSFLAASALALVAAPAAGASYTATLALPADARIVARDINWACGADGCSGVTDQSRPAVLCQALAKRAGKVDSFLVDGRAFTASELDRCNAAAKAGEHKALAAQ